MKSQSKKQADIFQWEIWGVLFIILVGALLHFVFDFSGGWKPLGIISAVNESVWEHLKLTFWPAISWTVIEFLFVRRPAKNTGSNFLFAKAIGVCTMPLVIVAIFYSYTAFTVDSILAVDLTSFVVAVVLGQTVSYKIWCSSLRLSMVFSLVGMALLVIGVVLFAVFTFYQPATSVFQDPLTGGYGILK